MAIFLAAKDLLLSSTTGICSQERCSERLSLRANLAAVPDSSIETPIRDRIQIERLSNMPPLERLLLIMLDDAREKAEITCVSPSSGMFEK
jgi:hypothetical protein